MNERIRQLYDQAIVIEDGGDYVCGELDPVKFAELIVRECMTECETDTEEGQPLHLVSLGYSQRIKEHFGVEE